MTGKESHPPELPDFLKKNLRNDMLSGKILDSAMRDAPTTAHLTSEEWIKAQKKALLVRQQTEKVLREGDGADSRIDTEGGVLFLSPGPDENFEGSDLIIKRVYTQANSIPHVKCNDVYIFFSGEVLLVTSRLRTREPAIIEKHEATEEELITLLNIIKESDKL